MRRLFELAICLVFIALSVPAVRAQDDAFSRPVRLLVGEGQIARLPGSVDRAFIADPSVADVEPVSSDSLYIFGVQVGETTIAAVDGNGTLVSTLRVSVHRSAKTAQNSADRLGLGGDVSVVYLDNRPVISGSVDTPREARRVEELQRQLDGETNAVDLTEYTGSTQVLLQLRIAEIQTVGLRDIGIRFDPESDSRILNALASQGYAQILAEPVLLTTSGTPAQFRSGGEFAYDSGNSGEDGGNIGFRSYGVSLDFTPTILDSNRVSLVLQAEVSAPSAGATSQSNAGQVPGRTLRSVSNTVELQSDETYVIAGLLQQNGSLSTSGVPGLSQLPLLGNLFRRQRFEAQETEIIVLVTPKIVPRNYTPNTAPTVAAPTFEDVVGFTLRPGVLD